MYLPQLLSGPARWFPHGEAALATSGGHSDRNRTPDHLQRALPRAYPVMGLHQARVERRGGPVEPACPHYEAVSAADLVSSLSGSGIRCSGRDGGPAPTRPRPAARRTGDPRAPGHTVARFTRPMDVCHAGYLSWSTTVPRRAHAALSSASTRRHADCAFRGKGYRDQRVGGAWLAGPGGADQQRGHCRCPRRVA
jgi:hypothetical protein